MRTFRKINIYYRAPDGRWCYMCSTTWSKTCREAKARYIASEAEQGHTYEPASIRANFD